MIKDSEVGEILEYEMVPGTIQLIDVTGTLDVQKNNDDSNIILQPQPSSNPNDPLRFSNTKRRLQFLLLFVWCVLQSATSNFTGPLYDAFVEDLHVTYDQINDTAALCFTGLGVGVVIAQPCAAKFGQRVVYLSCTLIAIIACIVGGTAKGLSSLYIFNLLCGFGAAPVDSLAEVTATNLTFQHERSMAVAVIIMALYVGCYGGPIVAGYITENLGWRWCYHIQIILYCALFIVMFFSFEETTFKRNIEKEDEFEEKILHQVQSMQSQDFIDPSSEMKEKLYDKLAVEEVSTSSVAKKTYWQRMKLIQTDQADDRSWLHIFIRPIFLIYFPAIIWASICYGAQMMWLSLMGNTQTLFYASEPYNMSADQVGLTNLSPLIGVIFGMLYGGPFVDWFSVQKAKRNNGISEPEHKLWTMAIPLITNAAGLIAYGFGPYYKAHWAISVIIGQGLLGFSMAATGSLCLSYGAFDCYHKLAGESIVWILFVRNMIGMIFCFVCQPWINSGIISTTVTMCALSVAINGAVVIFLAYGKSFRKWTAEPYSKISDPNYGSI